ECGRHAVAGPQRVVEMERAWLATQLDVARGVARQLCGSRRVGPDSRQVRLDALPFPRLHEDDVQHAIGAVGLGRKSQVWSGHAEVEHLDEHVLPGQPDAVDLRLTAYGSRLAEHPAHDVERR